MGQCVTSAHRNWFITTITNPRRGGEIVCHIDRNRNVRPKMFRQHSTAKTANLFVRSHRRQKTNVLHIRLSNHSGNLSRHETAKPVV